MELRAMWQATAIPWLRQAKLAEGVFLSRRLQVWGIAESLLAEQVADLLALANPTVAPYAGGGQVTLRVTAQGADAIAARALLEPVEQEIRGRIGLACFGADEESLASVVLRELAERGQTLAVAESCTGGGLGAALAAVPGASQCWLGGVMAYANAAKEALLGVPADLLDRWGAVSDPVALAMALGVRDRFGSDWAVATTGIAGPGGGSAEKPVGLVHVAVVGPEPFDGWSEGVRFGASRGRQAIQAISVGEALNRLRLSLLQGHA
jgi:nicotinamide-nucleotide amidase